MSSFNRKKLKFLGISLATLTATTVTLVACGNESKNSGDNKVINWYIPTEISTLDISKNTDAYSNLAIGNSGSNLLRIDKEGKPKPDLAKKVSVSSDGLTYTATLRDNLKWSDGSKLSAEDFVYTWRRIVDPKTASEYAYLATESHLLNADKINSGDIKDLNKLGVTAKGNQVTFKLTSPCPQFKYYLAFSNFMPQKQSYVEKVGKDYGTTSKNQIYSGPYLVKDWNGSNGKFKLVKNKYYWDSKHVKTNSVIVQTIKKPDTAVQMYKQGQIDFAEISGTSAIYQANKNNKDVVDASESLVPKKLAKLPNGEDLSKYTAPGYTYNTSKAQKLFKEGLAEVGQSSLKLTITADSDSPAAKNDVDYVKSTWESALPGLTVEEKFVTFKQRLEDAKNENFDVVLFSWGGDYPEGSTFYGLFTTNSAYNYGKFSSKEYDNAYQKAITTDALKPGDAANDYKTAEKALFDQSYYNPVYYLGKKGLQNSKLKGLVRNSTGLNVDFTYAYKTE
ncbi:peptide ABC transporter substrate-binding protein [Streptococcus agalactiae]|uniref:peptide ABC transporter substrate-binding protein n=1 Tax=Streptococcus agalactiae TaxID=1311 RepID=UPI0002BA0E18|nr:peptide ABC transporter substrate-binding protein [Streptococcus agalactiae]AIF88581.1 ABC transporter substrate-binding protein [Streptococcus agalactiae]EPT78609.1 ABC transporter substrate-binding protein [Streptococcus agalactiae LMG 15091]EPV52848.1 ABC transporter substrate-binding protein [Streptococcus agalactiae GB00911]EPV67426.1 ABC transporter substrate-binding protein [Streptococcus agalactiae GB00933]MCW1458431.1 peptide ABC transporter substrate-binding protein [Streptococcus